MYHEPNSSHVLEIQVGFYHLLPEMLYRGEQAPFQDKADLLDCVHAALALALRSFLVCDKLLLSIISRATQKLLPGVTQRKVALASMTKLYASEVATRAALDAVQLHGGYGFTEEFSVGRYVLEAKVLGVGEGNNQLHRDILADWAFGVRNY